MEYGEVLDSPTNYASFLRTDQNTRLKWDDYGKNQSVMGLVVCQPKIICFPTHPAKPPVPPTPLAQVYNLGTILPRHYT